MLKLLSLELFPIAEIEFRLPPARPAADQADLKKMCPSKARAHQCSRY
jgi:hypothetical protein